MDPRLASLIGLCFGDFFSRKYLDWASIRDHSRGIEPGLCRNIKSSRFHMKHQYVFLSKQTNMFSVHSTHHVSND